MRTASLLVGVAFLAVALAMAVDDPLLSIGALWGTLNPNSLVGFGALVEKRVDPDLWLHVVLPVLGWPAWTVPLLAGAILLAAMRPWRSRRRRSWHR